jgi:hypothetical protein
MFAATCGGAAGAAACTGAGFGFLASAGLGARFGLAIENTFIC